MTSKALPIAGYAHLALAAHNDERTRARVLEALRDQGFKVEKNQLIPPPNADSRSIIRALTAAHQHANGS